MDLNNLPPLQHLISSKITSLLLLDRDIERMLDKDLMMPLRYDYFERSRHNLWELITQKVAEKLPLLAPPLKINVAKYLRAMHLEIVFWLRDHDLSPQRKGLEINYRNMICWKYDGTIDREQTAKNYVQNGSIDARDRFIMACNYFLTDEILDLWDLIKVVGLQCTSRRGLNSAVRLWMNLLMEGKTEPTEEMIEEHFKAESLKESDIPLRINAYFRFLCRECRRDYVIKLTPFTVHKDDFRSCLLQMDETERIALLESKPGHVVARLLEWPFQYTFIKVAAKVSSQLSLSDYKTLLAYMVKYFILKGYDFFDIFREFWSIIPNYHKNEIKKDEKRFKAYEAILNFGKENQSKSLVVTVAEYFYS
ncbi:unnamed protein product [Larinioides sclopetarius]|uniref:Uncharacterized protein n=1 Tax=Larinioides sclopetarius TaxID=280406 RepID=A0AAV1ZL51_9ARAC